jgi:hypothetical protein
VNITVKGGILGRINYQLVGDTSELLPGDGLNVKTGFIFGFGQVTISIRAYATNVKEISIKKNAMIILFFIFIK